MRGTLVGATLALFLLPGSALAKSFEEFFPGISAEMHPDAVAALEPLDFRQGRIVLGGGLATLELGRDFYYLDPADADHVLETLWGNPPAEGTLGMIFPADTTPIGPGNWGIEIHFEEVGYVSDEGAAGYDYDALLRDMQADARAENGWRRDNGYPSIELVGWAAAPRYDQEGRKLYWAKELRFEGNDLNTLNYNIRALGRRGVLTLTFIAEMDALAGVERALPAVLDMVSFAEGHRYADFDPSVDTVAAVGIGGLIAGKVLAKTGLLAVALLFLKKFWFLALLPAIWLWKLFTVRRSS